MEYNISDPFYGFLDAFSMGNFYVLQLLFTF